MESDLNYRISIERTKDSPKAASRKNICNSKGGSVHQNTQNHSYWASVGDVRSCKGYDSSERKQNSPKAPSLGDFCNSMGVDLPESNQYSPNCSSFEDGGTSYVDVSSKSSHNSTKGESI